MKRPAGTSDGPLHYAHHSYELIIPVEQRPLLLRVLCLVGDGIYGLDVVALVALVAHEVNLEVLARLLSALLADVLARSARPSRARCPGF